MPHPTSTPHHFWQGTATNLGCGHRKDVLKCKFCLMRSQRVQVQVKVSVDMLEHVGNPKQTKMGAWRWKKGSEHWRYGWELPPCIRKVE